MKNEASEELTLGCSLFVCCLLLVLQCCSALVLKRFLDLWRFCVFGAGGLNYKNGDLRPFLTFLRPRTDLRSFTNWICRIFSTLDCGLLLLCAGAFPATVPATCAGFSWRQRFKVALHAAPVGPFSLSSSALSVSLLPYSSATPLGACRRFACFIFASNFLQRYPRFSPTTNSHKHTNKTKQYNGPHKADRPQDHRWQGPP